MSRTSALKVLDHGMIGPEGTDNCHKFVDILGLRTIFPLFMKTPKKMRKTGVSEREHEGQLLITAGQRGCNLVTLFWSLGVEWHVGSSNEKEIIATFLNCVKSRGTNYWWDWTVFGFIFSETLSIHWCQCIDFFTLCQYFMTPRGGTFQMSTKHSVWEQGKGKNLKRCSLEIG